MDYFSLFYHALINAQMLFCEQRWSQTKAPSLAKCSRQLPVSQEAVVCEESMPVRDRRAENTDICDSDPERKEGDMGMSLGSESPLTVLRVDVYSRMYGQSRWRFFLGVPFWLWNSCVCVRSYICLYLYISISGFELKIALASYFF